MIRQAMQHWLLLENMGLVFESGDITALLCTAGDKGTRCKPTSKLVIYLGLYSSVSNCLSFIHHNHRKSFLDESD